MVPKSANLDRLVENLQVFQLSNEDFDVVDTLRTDDTAVRYMDPRNHVGFDIFDEEVDEPIANKAPWD